MTLSKKHRAICISSSYNLQFTVEELGLISPTRKNTMKLKVGTDALRKATNYTKDFLPSMTLSDTLSPTRDIQALT